MKVIGYIALGIVSLAILLSLLFGLTWLGIEWRGFFGPKRAAVEREIFMETRSYNQGMLQQLSRYRLEYIRSDDEKERAAIASTVRQMFSEFDADTLPSQELRAFWKEVNE